MEELINKNNQLFKEVVETLPNIQQSIDDTTKNYQYYLGSIKNEVFEIKDNETYSEAFKRGEGIFDRMDETERRRKLVIEKSQETINQIEIMKNKMSRIIEECNHDEETLSKTRNELIDKIISIEEMIMKDKLFRKPKETDTITAEFNKKKEEWQTYYSDYLERKKREEEEEAKEKNRREEERRKEKERKKQEGERLRITKGMNTMEEMLQIEEWTNRKVGNILFDSDKDDWNILTSVFDQRIINKEHIIIIIKDEEGNKFGGYVNSKIDEVDGDISDSKSFVFSLESKGRMKGMKKFDIEQPERAFWLGNQTVNYSFEYNGISNALCGKEYPNHFTPKRIIVIEMK
ncbi:predicted protein [Entamoeba histolytica]|uniref:TLDc domain-containing protein n=2 Tax=Entamoeba histolytica TaxID=5759 RepID=B1N569_ENTH1|nr:predicted protein [Entamoeba histolytica HM-1:IMSS]EDS88889.1 predicted protein [Entamoeba histolytica HM-1:IMSS]GAT99258.1 predicted protein [Entamoeba histolytica]|eukprot:XP_001914335.1 predicted protein [Entamoeba histolytica HM-1:IMSS]